MPTVRKLRQGQGSSGEPELHSKFIAKLTTESDTVPATPGHAPAKSRHINSHAGLCDFGVFSKTPRYSYLQAHIFVFTLVLTKVVATISLAVGHVPEIWMPLFLADWSIFGTFHLSDFTHVVRNHALLDLLSGCSPF